MKTFFYDSDWSTVNTWKTVRGFLLVKVPMTLPSSFLATESQSWEAMSAATFFAGEGWRRRMKITLPTITWVWERDVASYRWDGPSSSPALAPCLPEWGSWSPPGPSASQTSPQSCHPFWSWEEETKLSKLFHSATDIWPKCINNKLLVFSETLRETLTFLCLFHW